jgi:hypothetical protein
MPSGLAASEAMLFVIHVNNVPLILTLRRKFVKDLMSTLRGSEEIVAVGQVHLW